MNFGDIFNGSMFYFFDDILDEMINYFSNILADIMQGALTVLNMPLVNNVFSYAQALAFSILTVKTIYEAFSTYILHQSGDPDADPAGLLIRTAQAVAVIASCKWIVITIFEFGSKVTSDIADLSVGELTGPDWDYLFVVAHSTGAVVVVLLLIIVLILMLVVVVHSSIRGAEIALLIVVGPFMALNISANNRNIWSAYFKQVIAVCMTQALQLFMLKGALSLLTNQIVSSGGTLAIIGWLWVTFKTPKFLQGFIHSTGFVGALGGAARQVGSAFLMRKMITK